uniref:Uncharacterized protein n=1 Tax=Arundo donax TaxID=35708 RepID=A0A0A9BIJ7_ARUDO
MEEGDLKQSPGINANFSMLVDNRFMYYMSAYAWLTWSPCRYLLQVMFYYMSAPWLTTRLSSCL